MLFQPLIPAILPPVNGDSHGQPDHRERRTSLVSRTSSRPAQTK